MFPRFIFKVDVYHFLKHKARRSNVSFENILFFLNSEKIIILVPIPTIITTSRRSFQHIHELSIIDTVARRPFPNCLRARRTRTTRLRIENKDPENNMLVLCSEYKLLLYLLVSSEDNYFLMYLI